MYRGDFFVRNRGITETGEKDKNANTSVLSYGKGLIQTIDFVFFPPRVSLKSQDPVHWVQDGPISIYYSDSVMLKRYYNSVGETINNQDREAILSDQTTHGADTQHTGNIQANRATTMALRLASFYIVFRIYDIITQRLDERLLYTVSDVFPMTLGVREILEYLDSVVIPHPLVTDESIVDQATFYKSMYKAAKGMKGEIKIFYKMLVDRLMTIAYQHVSNSPPMYQLETPVDNLEFNLDTPVFDLDTPVDSDESAELWQCITMDRGCGLAAITVNEYGFDMFEPDESIVPFGDELIEECTIAGLGSLPLFSFSPHPLNNKFLFFLIAGVKFHLRRKSGCIDGIVFNQIEPSVERNIYMNQIKQSISILATLNITHVFTAYAIPIACGNIHLEQRINRWFARMKIAYPYEEAVMLLTTVGMQHITEHIINTDDMYAYYPADMSAHTLSVSMVKLIGLAVECSMILLFTNLLMDMYINGIISNGNGQQTILRDDIVDVITVSILMFSKAYNILHVYKEMNVEDCRACDFGYYMFPSAVTTMYLRLDALMNQIYAKTDKFMGPRDPGYTSPFFFLLP